jgi:phospholipid-binding lipoprotein MlaA
MAKYNAIDPLENASEKDAIELGITLLEAVDKRHQVGFRYFETGSPFEYDLVRLIYLKNGNWILLNNKSLKRL